MTKVEKIKAMLARDGIPSAHLVAKKMVAVAEAPLHIKLYRLKKVRLLKRIGI